MNAVGTDPQPSPRPVSRRWVNANPTHDVRLTAEYLDTAPVGTVLSVLGRFGSGSRVPIAFAKRDDGTWTVHTRGRVTSDRLVGGWATPRRRAGTAHTARASTEVRREPIRIRTPDGRAGFADAVMRMAQARR